MNQAPITQEEYFNFTITYRTEQERDSYRRMVRQHLTKVDDDICEEGLCLEQKARNSRSIYDFMQAVMRNQPH